MNKEKTREVEPIIWNGHRWLPCDRLEWETISQYERFALVSTLGAEPYLYFKQDPAWSKS